MATAGDFKLDASKIAFLAEAIGADCLEMIALKHLGIHKLEIQNLKREHRENIQAFSRDILRKWAWKNPEPGQVKVLASILYKAARDDGNVNVSKVQEILGISFEEDAVKALVHDSDEIEELIEQLKDYVVQASKVPLVPWVEDYVVDMKDTYVELFIEKIENKPTGPVCTKVEHCAELFKDSKQRGRKGKGKKVLGKGDLGMGKSTFGMKAAYDWATGIFTDLTIVFFISLRLVRPGDSIENIIIQQTPPIEALEITEQKLKDILDTLGNRALLILDGLDEHELGSNEDIKKITEGRKLLHCNILLTSRPHCTGKIEKYFQTIVRIEGFTEDQTKLFVSKRLENKDKVEAVLRLNSENLISKDSPHSCPLLLLYACVLINSEELPVTRKVPLGEIYARLARCIYRNYCVWKDIDFEPEQFVTVLKKVGKIAYEMLLTNKRWTKQCQVIEELGEDGLEYGFLVGHKGEKLLGKETSDIFLVFVHRTIQEFLGAYFFTKELDVTENSKDLKNPLLEKNRLFQPFCGWLKSDESSDYFHNKLKT